MTQEQCVIDDLRTFATYDAHGGKVSKRVEVLGDRPPAEAGYEGLVAVRGDAPLGALGERTVDAASRTSVGWVDPATLRDWYRPDRVVVSTIEARRAGLEPGTYADSRARGRVRIDGLEAHLASDGRPAFRALAGSATEPKVDLPLPIDQVVRLVAVRDGATTPTGAAALSVVTTPVLPVLAPGRYPDHSADVVGLPPRAASGTVDVRAFAVRDGERHEIDRVDERAATIWLRRADGQAVPVAASEFAADLVRYDAARA